LISKSHAKGVMNSLMGSIDQEDAAYLNNYMINTQPDASPVVTMNEKVSSNFASKNSGEKQQ
jgi:hypothetical protein